MSKLIAVLGGALLLGAGIATVQLLGSSGEASATTTLGSTGTTTSAATTTVEDVSGPCDEAEHRNDPRCTGGAVTATDDEADRADDDHSGRGRGGDDHDDDRSGSNSGRG